jgi:3-oxoacyl-[acyl-carrier protein] reductase
MAGMDTGLEGKVVLVTGASGGIGRAVAEAFASEGARVALQGNRQFEELEERVAGEPWRDRALCVRADMKRPSEVDAAVRHVAAEWGRVDVCVANAGIWPPDELLLHEIAEVRIREVVEVNLLGAVWTARAFLAALARTGPRDDGQGASIVFTGSTAGRFGELGHADYAISKAGLLGLVRTLKNEIVHLDPYGRANMVEPGWTVTAMARPALEDPDKVRHAVRTMPMRQLARAEDIARSIVFLSSPLLARHVSGQVITAAGGMEGRLLWEEESIDVGAVRARARQE